MRKFSLLLAFLCASVMAFAAIDWNNYEWIGDGAGGGAYSNKYKLAPAEGQGVVNIQKPGFADEAGIYTTFPAGVSSCSLGEGKFAMQGAGVVLYLSAFTLKETEVTVEHGTGTCVFTVFYVDGEESASGKADPELKLNETAVTLNAANAETFQIVPTKKGTGVITYSSNNAGIASVSETGLVTALGRGTAKITVNLAETADYDDAIATLTVTVTGPINWDALAWVANSNDKYKVATADGQTVVNVQKPGFAEEDGIYTTFPAGVSSCSLGEGKYAVQGAGVVLYLSAFTHKETEVTVEHGTGTCVFTVYYVDGTDSTTAVINAEVGEKARKVVENGQVIIIKNGVRYSALGVQVKDGDCR